MPSSGANVLCGVSFYSFRRRTFSLDDGTSEVVSLVRRDFGASGLFLRMGFPRLR